MNDDLHRLKSVIKACKNAFLIVDIGASEEKLKYGVETAEMLAQGTVSQIARPFCSQSYIFNLRPIWFQNTILLSGSFPDFYGEYHKICAGLAGVGEKFVYHFRGLRDADKLKDFRLPPYDAISVLYLTEGLIGQLDIALWHRRTGVYKVLDSEGV